MSHSYDMNLTLEELVKQNILPHHTLFPFSHYCHHIAVAEGERGRLASAGIAAAAARAFRIDDPVTWTQVVNKAIPEFHNDPRSRLAMAPDAFREGICNALFACWQLARDDYWKHSKELHELMPKEPEQPHDPNEVDPF